MIVTSARGLNRTLDGTVWRCLARRGMVHSECEAFDYLRLPPGATRDGRGREGIEEAWFVLSGEGRFAIDMDRSITLRPGDVLLWSGGAGGSLRSAATSSLELLAFALLPAAVTGRLPVRSPMIGRPSGGHHG